MIDVLIRTFRVLGEQRILGPDNSAKAKNFGIFKFKPLGTPIFECLANFFDSKSISILTNRYGLLLSPGLSAREYMNSNLSLDPTCHVDWN